MQLDGGGSRDPTATDPLILTARFDPDSAEMFQRLRRQHFPARLNIVPAHLTLFHQLPGAERDEVELDLSRPCAETAPVRFAVSGVRFLGRGVAMDVESLGLIALRRQLAQGWIRWLVPQDRQPFKPHVTVQNKVDPAAARALHQRLEAQWEPMAGRIVGLDLWNYRGGPWEMARQFTFGA